MASFGQRLANMMRSLRAYERSLQHPLILSYKEADARGMHLLTRHLSPAQRDQYARHGYFDVIGGDTGGRYRIRRGHQMNVERIDRTGRPVSLLCFMPEGRLPVGDVMLAQKLALECFESEALWTANRLPASDDMTLYDGIGYLRRHPTWLGD